MPWNGFAGEPLIDDPGLPLESVRFTVTKSRSTGLFDPFVTRRETAKAGPLISPGPCALAVIGCTLTTVAVTFPPNWAVAFNGTLGAVVSTAGATVLLTLPRPPAGGTGVVAGGSCLVVDGEAVALLELFASPDDVEGFLADDGGLAADEAMVADNDPAAALGEIADSAVKGAVEVAAEGAAD